MHFNKEVISILFYIPSNFFRNKILADLGSALPFDLSVKQTGG